MTRIYNWLHAGAEVSIVREADRGIVAAVIDDEGRQVVAKPASCVDDALNRLEDALRNETEPAAPSTNVRDLAAANTEPPPEGS